MSVLHLRASNFYGGPERQLHCHARAARDSVFEVIVASYAESGRSPDLLARVAADRLPTHLVGVAGAYDRRALGLIRRVLRDRDIAILCTHDYRSTVLGCLAVRFTPVRWIAFSRGRTRETLRIRLYNELERLCLRFADRVVAVSEGEKASLRRRLVPDRRIAVVHNAIDTAAFAAVTPVDLKSRFGFPAHSLVAVAAGRFSPEKGQLDLVRAAELALPRLPGLRFVLFGDGPDLERTRHEIESRGLNDRVLCPGFERDLAACLRGADLVVNPSLSEGLPNVVLEAMALGVPVVATAVGGVPELIRDGDTGLLPPPADPRQLADALVRMGDDPALRRRVAANALNLVRESFSFEKQARELFALYADVLNQRDRTV